MTQGDDSEKDSGGAFGPTEFAADLEVDFQAQGKAQWVDGKQYVRFGNLP
jgi:hypothetical protein